MGRIVARLRVRRGFSVPGNNLFACVFVPCRIGGAFFSIFDYWDREDCALNGLGCGIGRSCFRFASFCPLNGTLAQVSEIRARIFRALREEGFRGIGRGCRS